MIIDDNSGEIKGDIVTRRSDKKSIFIELSKVSYCEDLHKDYYSYTFPVQNAEDGYIFNLVIENNSGVFNTFLMKYEISKQDRMAVMTQQLKDKIFVPFSIENVDPLRIKPRGCQTVTIFHCISCTGSPNHTCEEIHNCRCTGSMCNPPYVIITTEQQCDGDETSEDSGITIYPHDENSGANSPGGGTYNPSTPNEEDGSGTEMLMNSEDYYDFKVYSMLRDYNLDMSIAEFKSIVPMDICMNGATPENENFEKCAFRYLEKIKLQDVSPCTRDVVKYITKMDDPESNLLLRTINEIFNSGDAVDVIIKEETLDKELDGTFDNASGGPGFTSFIFSGDLTINSRYTTSGTKDWVLATIIHEFIHGYVRYFELQKTRGWISSSEFDNLFPLFSTSGVDYEHELMAYKYVDVISDILKDANPSLQDNEAKALAWVGLQGTNAYLTMHSQGKAPSLSTLLSANNHGRGTEINNTSNQKPCD